MQAKLKINSRSLVSYQPLRQT